MPLLAPPPELPPPPADGVGSLGTAVPGPQSVAWLARLKRVESPGVTFVVPGFPIVWSSARGACVRDVDGNTYLDATSAFGVGFVGHAHPRVVEAATHQAQRLPHGMGDVHPPTARIALLEVLADWAPGDLGHGVLCTSGSEAVEVALKTAVRATGRPGVLAFHGAYHGLGTGALDTTSRRAFRDPFAALLGRNTLFLPWPDADTPPCGVAAADVCAHVLARVDEALGHPAAGGLPVGAVIVEPIQGRGGCRIPPAGFLPGLRAACDRHGALLVLDEIYTGFGRTGVRFACDAEAVVPDLLLVGKALGGGFPIAACLGRPGVMAAWGESSGEALHTSTFLGHPVACAAALATLAVIETEGLIERARATGVRLLADLQMAFAGLRSVHSVRGRGLLLGIELRDPHSGLPGTALAWSTTVEALRRGLIVLPAGSYGEVVQLAPPAVLTDTQRDWLVATLAAALQAASGA
ncbi:MAG: aspartate aminotransferase family protein [Myxococcales bacterium]|nr:aspartate aminotransferase family protein [Myxococcales bacterium]